MDDPGCPRPSSATSWSKGSEIKEHPRSAWKTNCNISNNCHRLESTTSWWWQIVKDRALWKATIKAAAGVWGGKEAGSRHLRQRRRKAASQPQTPDQVLIFPRCTKTCGSQNGLHSHRRVCDRSNGTTSQWIFGYED